MKKDYIKSFEVFNEAKEMFAKLEIDKETKHYTNEKEFVKTAKKLFRAVEIALNIYFDKNNVPKVRGRKNINYYHNTLEKINPELYKYFYQVHIAINLSMIYDKFMSVRISKIYISQVNDFLKKLNKKSQPVLVVHSVESRLSNI